MYYLKYTKVGFYNYVIALVSWCPATYVLYRLIKNYSFTQLLNIDLRVQWACLAEVFNAPA